MSVRDVTKTWLSLQEFKKVLKKSWQTKKSRVYLNSCHLRQRNNLTKNLNKLNKVNTLREVQTKQ